ncbi:A24 family peptidase [Methylobacterium nodulans]|uniref:Peptidase A24A prepilin type IV n=1 Tax=Methylobacterium nodulans (strain LMG 21967 / CNCM I-2342 / ORS 2060) TaxID=460265 RepID=B8IGQ1_METNO|nr:prepilin peptidase [Methylobacterium nodulans]ACL57776.1 peptidase A24A prepilin type IV [Methylobacterium nodulans ORS 2060]
MASVILLVVFPFLMAYAAASDLLTMTIPNALSLVLVAVFPLAALALGLSWSEVGLHLGAGGLTLALTFTLFCFGLIGGGDAKLAAATALWLGFEPLADYVLAASLAGGVLTLLILQVRIHPLPRIAVSWPWALRLHDRRTGVPYGIALAFAALVVCPAAPMWHPLLSA